MCTKKKKIIICIIAALLILFLGWRMWPHPLDKVISADMDSITSLACNVSISGLEDSGDSYIDSYTLQALSEDDEHFQNIIDILKSTEYRQNFRNLLPWSITSVDAGKNYDGRSANVLLAWGSEDNENCYLSFLDNNTIVISSINGDILQIYHPINRAVLDELVDYIQIHGK
ncbi:MAG: hypothetical protein J6A75_01110 [Lachnospiraceae bacterium]|nr:hypothetical protein [Lachnospiraceae bacterium]